MVWSAGTRPKRCRLVHAVRDRAFLLGPPGIWDSEWVNVPASAVCAEDIAQWPYTPGLLVKWVSFLNGLHWPVGDLDLGVGGVSYVELQILYELWAGARLTLVIFVQDAQFQCRLFRLVQALIFGVPVVFIGALMRSLCLLLEGLVGFYLVILVLIIAGFVILVGRNVVMVSLPDHGRVLRSFS